MANLVLYRRYRPQTFGEFIGQEYVIKTITNAILNKQVSHAYLFSGPRGSGKTTLARLLAKAVNCENPIGFEPCNKCSSCLEMNQQRAVDLIEIDAATHTGIDDVRELRDGIHFVPSKLKYKVFIIDECHQLSKAAANALLKTLEEPPSHTIFILATTEAYKMIPTIISRCQRFDFRKLTIPEITKKIEFICKKEKIKIGKEALNLIAQNARGSFRDAESLLDQVITLCGDREITIQDIKDLLGLVEIGQVAEFTDLIIKKETAKAIEFLNEISNKGLDLQEFIKTFVNYQREALVLKIDPTRNPGNMGLTKEELEKLAMQIQNLKEQEIYRILETFLAALNKMKYSPIPQLPLELAIVEICEAV